MKFRDFHNRMVYLKDNLQKESEKIILNDKEFILDLNRGNQLFSKGIDSEGRLLLRYSPFTISIKRQKGEVYNRTTLLDTGDFYKGFDLFFNNSKLTLFSRDSKTTELQDKYGSSIFGLTKDNQQVFTERFQTQLTNFINQYIKNGRSN